MLWVKTGPSKNDLDLESSHLRAFPSGETHPSAFVSYARLLLDGSCGLHWKWLPRMAGLSNPWPALPVLLSCAASSIRTLSGVTASEGTPAELHQ